MNPFDKLPKRRYPLGIQTFERIIEEGYVYVDKTDLVWELAHTAPFVFLSRPRRFGKSLLTTTLCSYFRGERELFEGLKIMDYETEWTPYPVIHLDMSFAKAQATAEALSQAIGRLVELYEDKYGAHPSEKTPGSRLAGVIRRAYEQTGRKVVVAIDEYDAPLLDVLHEHERLEAYRQVMQEVYTPLKASEAYLRFCFITGITKFSQLSIFSTLNNLSNVSMQPQFATICGITEAELTTVLAEDIAMLAEAYECSPEEMHQKLKLAYDGYHFSENMHDGLYNPFSLIKAFMYQKISNYWFDSGTPTFLIRQMQHFRTDITGLDDIEAPAMAFDRPTEAMEDALPLLYQSGYLTIKGYDRNTDTYHLAIPNQEVRIGFVQGLIPAYVGLGSSNVQVGFALKFWRALRKQDLNLALTELQTYLAGIPYVEGFKKKLAEAATAEGFYEYTLYLIFSLLNAYVRTQVKCRGGRIDVVVHMPDTTYVLELKTRGTAQEALAQIDERGYAFPFQTAGKPVVKAGLLFNMDTRTLDDWAIGR